MDEFRDLMTAQIDDAAARFADEDFAALYGRGIVSRVRRRRTVRAVGVGGVSAMVVGALAVGATHLPNDGAQFGLGGASTDGCSPTAVAAIDAIWTVRANPRAHVIDVSSEFETETWYLYDDLLEMVVLQMVPGAAGLEVTYADGTREFVQSDASPFVFEAPGGGLVTFDPADTVHHAIWNLEAPTEPSPIKALTDVNPPFAWQWSGCGFGSPSASADTSGSNDPSPTPSMANRVISSLPYETPDDVWLTSGGERVALFFWRQASEGLVTLRASESGEVIPSLGEYTVAVVDGIARVPVGDVVVRVRVRVGAGDTVTVESVEPAGAQASIGSRTSVAIDPWFSLGVANTIDLDEVVDGAGANGG